MRMQGKLGILFLAFLTHDIYIHKILVYAYFCSIECFMNRLLCHLGCLPVIQTPVLCLPSGIPSDVNSFDYRV